MKQATDMEDGFCVLIFYCMNGPVSLSSRQMSMSSRDIPAFTGLHCLTRLERYKGYKEKGFGSKVKITIGYVGCAINRVFVDLFVIQSHQKLQNFTSEF